jgi:hypothetical protein
MKKFAWWIFAAIAPIKRMTFEEWLKGKKFVNLETKQTSPFIMLPLKQRLDLKQQYEKSEDERIEAETKKKRKRSKSRENSNENKEKILDILIITGRKLVLKKRLEIGVNS